MKTVFIYALGRMRGQILGWGLTLAVLGFYLVKFYDTIVDQQEQLMQMMASYPKELFAFFGGMDALFTPAGYLNVEFFSYMPIILGIFAVLAASGLLAGDEESGILDLVLSYPLSRTILFWGRVAAFLAATLGILILIWMAFLLGIQGTQLELSPGELVLPALSLLAVLILFGALALALSMLVPARRIAAMLSGVLLVASFFITSLAEMDEKLEMAADFSPLSYYQGGMALDGMKWEWLGGLLGAGLLFLLLAWWLFERRDIRVGGEGSWKLPGLGRLKRRRAA